MRVAILKDSLVINVIVSDIIPDNGIECPDFVHAGWTYDAKKFIAPAAEFVDLGLDS